MTTKEVLEIALGSDPLTATPVWTDISDYVASPINITRGRADELGEIQPSGLSTTLDDSTGKFTVGGPNALAGLDFANRIRCQILTNLSPAENPAVLDTFTRSVSDSWGTSDSGHTWVLSGTAADFDVTGTLGTQALTAVNTSRTSTVSVGVNDFDIRGNFQTNAVAQTDNQNVFLIGRFLDVDNFYGVRLALKPNQTVDMTIRKRVAGVESAIGSTVAMAFSHQPNTPYTIRFQIIETTLRAKAWLASNAEPEDWALIVTDTDFAGPGGVGVRSSLNAGNTNTLPVVASWDNFSSSPVSRTHVNPRFDGFLNQLPVNWIGSAEEDKAVVPITATDIFKRLGQQSELATIWSEQVFLDMKTYAPAGAHYPLTESGSVGSDRIGQGALDTVTKQRGSGGELTFGSDGDGPSAEGFTVVNFAPTNATNGKYLLMDLGETLNAASSSFRTVIELWFKTTVTSRDMVLFTLWNASRSAMLNVYVESTDGKVYRHLEVDGSATGNASMSTVDVRDGNWHHLAIAIDPSFTGTLGQTVGYFDGAAGGSGSWDHTLIDLPSGLRYLEVGGGALPSWTSGVLTDATWSGGVSNVSVYVGVTSSAQGAVADHYLLTQTETGDLRAGRLLSYGLGSGYPLVAQGPAFSNVGQQVTEGKGPIESLREVEAAEGGVLISERDYGGTGLGPIRLLRFQSRGFRYNPVESLTLTPEHVEGTPTASFDDQQLLNEYTVTRPGGSPQRVVDLASRAKYGRYADSVEIAKATDAEARDAAQWAVNRRSVPSSRFGALRLNRHLLSDAMYETLLDLDVSSVISVTDLPDATAWTDSALLFIEGYSETITVGANHSIELLTSPAEDYFALTLDHAVYGTLDANRIVY